MDETSAVTVAINVQTPNGFDMTTNNFDSLLGNALVQGNTATGFTKINAANNAKFVADGADFTYATDKQGVIHVTGGTVSTLHWLTNDNTPAPIADFSGFRPAARPPSLQPLRRRPRVTRARSML